MAHYNFIIPERNRKDSLAIFLEKLPKIIEQKKYITSYNILVCEQMGEDPFNLGKLINCGFDLSKKNLQYPYDPAGVLCFFPVDCIPEDLINLECPEKEVIWFCDKESHSQYPKAIMMRNFIFESLNGHTNTFHSWGNDDVEQLIRCRITNTDISNRYVEWIDNESKDPKGQSLRYFHMYQREIICDLNKTKNIYYSGLNTLEYQLINFSYLSSNIVIARLSLLATCRGIWI